jgi:hypothetical protein
MRPGSSAQRPVARMPVRSGAARRTGCARRRRRWRQKSRSAIPAKPFRSETPVSHRARRRIIHITGDRSKRHTQRLQAGCKYVLSTPPEQATTTLRSSLSAPYRRSRFGFSSSVCKYPRAFTLPGTAACSGSVRRCQAGRRRQTCPCSPDVWPPRRPRAPPRRS